MLTSHEIREAKFKEFHEENPRVFHLIVKFARQAKSAGYSKCSIRLIAHRIRWYVHVDTKSEDGYRINNNHLSFYSREAERWCPDLEGFFTKRSSHASVDHSEFLGQGNLFE